MARHKEFEPEKLLEQAMYLFWEKGYHETSMSDVVEATGVQRYGIYAVYKNKHTLFLAALDRYRDAVRQGNLLPLTQPDAGLEEIKEALKLTVEYMTGEHCERGCFMCNSALTLASEDEDVADASIRYSQMVTGLIQAALLHAQEDGSLAADVDIDTKSNFLYGAFISIPTLVKMGQSKKAVTDYLDGIFTTMI